MLPRIQQQAPCLKCCCVARTPGHTRLSLGHQQHVCIATVVAAASAGASAAAPAPAAPDRGDAAAAADDSGTRQPTGRQTGERKPRNSKQRAASNGGAKQQPPGRGAPGNPTQSSGRPPRTASRRSSSSPSNGWAGRTAFANARLQSFPQLRRLLAAHGSAASLADLVAVASRLKSVDCAEGTAGKAAVLQELWHLVEPQLANASARHCAELMLTASRLGCCPKGSTSDMSLYAAACSQFVARMQARPEEAEPRILANAAYALGTAADARVRSRAVPVLQQQLLPALLQQAQRAYPQAICSVAYAVASIGDARLRPGLQQLLHAVPVSVWGAASLLEVSNVLWASGVLGLGLSPRLLAALVAAVLQQSAVAPGSAQSLANSVWGLAQLRYRGLQQQQARELAAVLLQLSAQAPDAHPVSSFVWSLAKMGLALPQATMRELAAVMLRSAGLQAKPQSISVLLWACATMGVRLQRQQLLELLQLLADAPADPQALGNSIWAAAKLVVGDALPLPLLHRLFANMASVVHQAQPQAVSNTLWAAAVMRCVPQALLGGHAGGQRCRAQPQDKAAAAAATATGQPQPSAVLAAVAGKVRGMRPMELSNVALALALLGEPCVALLDAVYDTVAAQLQQGANAASSAPAAAAAAAARADSAAPPADTPAAPQGVSSTCMTGSSAAARGRAAADTPPSPAAYSTQALCNLCWAGAVLDLRPRAQLLAEMAGLAAQRSAQQQQQQQQQQQHDAHDEEQQHAGLPQLMALDASGSSSPPRHSQDKVQLCQLDTWLQEELGQPGLAPHHVRAVYLQQCRAALQRVLAAGTCPSQGQLAVYAAAQRLPCLRRVVLEAATPDGLMSVDVLAEVVQPAGGADGLGSCGAAADAAAPSTSSSSSSSSSDAAQDGGSGSAATRTTTAVPRDDHHAHQQQEPQPQPLKVAIEFDGPWHFRRPDRRLTGPTLLRNRLLACRGYVLVPVPFWEWAKCRTSAAQQQYLRAAVERAVKEHQRRQQQEA